MTSQPPLIAHVIHQLSIGGLENGVVNLINGMPEAKYRHAIVCMDDYSGFRDRIRRADVEVYAIRKQPGQDPASLWRTWRLLRQIRPSIVHTRNLAALDAVLPAVLAGVPTRIHGEHGRDIDDLDGSNRKLQWLRRLRKPLIDHYIPLSIELEAYLQDKIGIDADRITRIYNGVDTDVFRPRAGDFAVDVDMDRAVGPDSLVVGTVGRIQAVKGHTILVAAVAELLRRRPDIRQRLRLAMIGDGPAFEQLRREVHEAGLEDITWLPGARDDVASLLRRVDIFVQPSLAEGISNTLLEAMATGIPAIATAIGGNPELVTDNESGLLVPPGDAAAIADALETLIEQPALRGSYGLGARNAAETTFDMSRMVERYMSVYDRFLESRPWV